MPSRSFYTQAVAILLRQAIPLDAIESCLSGFTIVKRQEESTDWRLSGPSLVIAYRPEINGYVIVDIVDQCWPDQMGDPKTDFELFGAWSSGQFGPITSPGSLKRACEHAWTWPDGHSVPLQHQAFIRIRTSYNFGTESPVVPQINMPKSYDAVHELKFVTNIAAALVRLPQAICYFNPNGECVRGASQFLECLNDDHSTTGDMPLWVWSNVRLFKVPKTDPLWNLMDTVGMSQLDAPDHEAFYQSTAYEPVEVDAFLRIMSSYIVTKGPIIKHGDTADGPGNVRWQGFHVTEALIEPARPVIRWFPLDRRKIPAALAKGPVPQFMSWKEAALRILGVRQQRGKPPSPETPIGGRDGMTRENDSLSEEPRQRRIGWLQELGVPAAFRGPIADSSYGMITSTSRPWLGVAIMAGLPVGAALIALLLHSLYVSMRAFALADETGATLVYLGGGLGPILLMFSLLTFLGLLAILFNLPAIASRYPAASFPNRAAAMLNFPPPERSRTRRAASWLLRSSVRCAAATSETADEFVRVMAAHQLCKWAVYALLFSAPAVLLTILEANSFWVGGPWGIAEHRMLPPFSSHRYDLAEATLVRTGCSDMEDRLIYEIQMATGERFDLAHTRVVKGNRLTALEEIDSKLGPNIEHWRWSHLNRNPVYPKCLRNWAAQFDTDGPRRLATLLRLSPDELKAATTSQ